MKQSIIFLHGLFGGLSNWEESANYFKKDFTIYIPVLPIYDDHGDHILDYLVENLQKEIVARELENITLVGNSLGGHVGILYAHRFPAKVRNLILTGSSGLYENFLLGSFPRRRDRKYVKRQVENVFCQPETASDQLIDDVYQILGDARKCFKIIKTAKTTQRHDVSTILPLIQKPVLLIWGEDDKITPPSVAHKFAGLIADSKLVLLKNCGHAAMMEQPEEFNEAIAHFIQN